MGRVYRLRAEDPTGWRGAQDGIVILVRARADQRRLIQRKHRQ